MLYPVWFQFVGDIFKCFIFTNASDLALLYMESLTVLLVFVT